MTTEPTSLPELATEALPRESWRKRYPALDRFTRSFISVAALALVLLIVLTAAFGPMLWKFDPVTQDLDLVGEPQPPSWTHPAGTDFLGRDLLARLFLGARISLAVGIISMTINLFIGVGVGTMAGWLGGWVDLFIMRIVDSLYSIPLLLIVILLQIFAKPHLEAMIPPEANVPFLLSPDLLSIYIALGVANWLTMARLTRSEVINQSRRDYVAAARGLGAGNFRILIRHVLPNCMAPLLVAATLAIPEAIFIEAFLSFIGIGVSPPLASWGSLASEAAKSIGLSPHELVFPAVAISLTMLSFNLFGDGLRDAFDPSGKH